MKAADIIHSIRQAGGSITAENGELKLTAKEALPDALMEYIRKHKTALIAELSKPAWAEGSHPVIENGKTIGYRIADEPVQRCNRLSQHDRPTEPDHGACVHCGCDTDAMLTVPGKQRQWCCVPCFDKRAA